MDDVDKEEGRAARPDSWIVWRVAAQPSDDILSFFFCSYLFAIPRAPRTAHHWGGGSLCVLGVVWLIDMCLGIRKAQFPWSQSSFSPLI